MLSQAQMQFPDYIERSDGTKHLIKTDQFQGGYQEVSSKTVRNALPEDKRTLGMIMTWNESGRYISARFEGTNVLDANWTNDANWINIYVEGEGLANLDSIIFNPIDVSTYSPGRLKYENFTHSLTFTNDIPDFTHQLGYEFVIRVYNNTVDTIFDGTVIRGTGSFKNGSIVPTIAKAGNGSQDSLAGVALTTVTIPPNQHGIVTLLGPVNNLDLSAFSDGDEIFVGANGTITNIPPEPPLWNRRLGQVIYAHVDSGQVFVNPSSPNLSPAPHIAGDTARYNQAIVLTQNVFSYIPISSTAIEDQIGYTLMGDSIQVDIAGHVSIFFNMSYIGNNQSDTWRIGIFKNGIEVNSVSRSTASVSVGNSTCIASPQCAVGDYISFKMTNESATRNATISDMSFDLIYLRD
jgi:hypothetical protein